MQLAEAREQHTAKTLAMWRYAVPNARHALLPPNTCRPNPLLWSDGTPSGALVIASLFSPGLVCAVEQSSGALRWQFDLQGFGTSSVYIANSILYAQSANTLYALEPATGRLLWQLQPYAERSESIYSSVVESGGRLFLGDRSGWVHALCAQSGRTLWKQHATSGEEAREEARQDGPSVNATALVSDERVFVATNAGQAVALEAGSGRVLWTQSLDGPCIHEVRLFGGCVLLQTPSSLFFLHPETGAIDRQERFSPEEIRKCVVAGDRLLVVTRQRAEREAQLLKDDDHEGAAMLTEAETSVQRLIGLHPARTSYIRPAERFVTGLRWDCATGLVYESRLDGLGLLDPATGERLHNISGEGAHGLSTGLASVQDGRLYLLAERGTLLALRHPETTL